MDSSEPRMNSDAVSSNMHGAICHVKRLFSIHYIYKYFITRGEKEIWDLEFIYIL